jgi:hypothetical protein
MTEKKEKEKKLTGRPCDNCTEMYKYGGCDYYEEYKSECEFQKPLAENETFLKTLKKYFNFPEEKVFTDIWEQIVKYLKTNVEFQDPRQYDIVTAWVFANWIPEKFETYPYLYFYGIPETGKNQALDSLREISFNGLSASNISTSALFRCIRPEIFKEKSVVKVVRGKPQTVKVKVSTGEYDYTTLFLDELSPLSKNASTDEQDKHRILNAGYKKGGSVIRCTGKNFKPKTFLVDGFKAIASIFQVPDALNSRCIMIQMVRTNRQFPIRRDENEIENILVGLRLWREIALKKMVIDLNIDTIFTETLLWNNCQNNRLVQLYYSLLRVTPYGKKDVILDYLRDEAKQKQQIASSSFEAEVFKSVLDVLKLKPSETWLSYSEVLSAYNTTHSEDFPLKGRTFHMLITSLGFRDYRKPNGRGFLISKNLIEKLKERFQIEPETEQTELTPEPQHDSDICPKCNSRGVSPNNNSVYVCLICGEKWRITKKYEDKIIRR